ncbi:MAG: NF038120 family PEP-CTERM protein [Gammaproteobacteria bacterium]
MAASAALLLGAPALASTITFSSLAPNVYAGGETLSEAGYDLHLLEGPVAAHYGFQSAIGTVANANDPLTCYLTSCPVGAQGNYLMVLNDGGVQFSRNWNAQGFRLSSLELAFIAPVPLPQGSYGRLRLTGTDLDGVDTYTEVALPGQDADGNFVFDAISFAPDFAKLVLSTLRIDACVYDENLSCVNDFDHPAQNQAQFALDNVALAEVPEPGSLLLAGAALGALVVRRRTNAAVKGA